MTASNNTRQQASDNLYHSRYVGTHMDVPFNNGILTLPADISQTLLERQSDIGKSCLVATIDKFEGDFKALRIWDIKSPLKEFSKHKVSYRIRAQKAPEDELQFIIPHQIAEKTLLHSRVYLAASDDGETFTIWPYDTYFRAIGSKC
ncbi:hypothetical protein J4219_00365 [Candidatus Woesearchaeota archaeon]|nr:hypothetical protein [Candidatus Woesearchaeota archaeon]